MYTKITIEIVIHQRLLNTNESCPEVKHFSTHNLSSIIFYKMSVDRCAIRDFYAHSRVSSSVLSVARPNCSRLSVSAVQPRLRRRKNHFCIFLGVFENLLKRHSGGKNEPYLFKGRLRLCRFMCRNSKLYFVLPRDGKTDVVSVKPFEYIPIRRVMCVEILQSIRSTFQSADRWQLWNKNIIVGTERTKKKKKKINSYVIKFKRTIRRVYN